MLLFLRRLFLDIERTDVGRRLEESFSGEAVRLVAVVAGGTVDFAER